MENQEAQVITTDELVELLKEVKHGEFVHIESLTTVKMNKTGNPYYNAILKRSKKNVRTLPDYEKRMRKVTENPDFVSKPNWFEHESPCVVRKKSNPSEKYFMYEMFDEQTVKNTYLHNNKEISKELFEAFMPAYKANDINVKVVSMTNIKRLSYRGNKYVIK